jgi:hypothetical protein
MEVAWFAGSKIIGVNNFYTYTISALPDETP